MNLSFEIDGQKVLSRELQIWAHGIKSMRPEFKEIGKLLEDSSESNFETQGTESGGQRKPLKPATVKARSEGSWGYRGKKRAAGVTASRPILVYTGKMRDSFTSDVQPLQVSTSNKAPYFKYHQSESRTGGKLPRRLILEMKSKDKVKIMNIIAKGIDKRFGNYGRQIG